MGAQGNAWHANSDLVIARARSALRRAPVTVMQGETVACDNLPRLGVCLGLMGLLSGLVIVGMTLGRPVGFGTAPVLGSESVDVQARVQLFGGCVPLLAGLLWGLAAPHSQVVVRLRPLVRAVIGLGFLSALLVWVVNWAAVMGHGADHFALVPALLDAVVALLYLVLLIAMPLGVNVPVASHLMMRGGAVWLLGYTIIRLASTSGRVFLDADRFMWFFDIPVVEMALLGCIIPSAIALVVGAMASIGDPRAIMRSLPTQMQIWNVAVFLWLLLRVWCLRYPGSYQKLLLALVGIVLLVVIGTVASDSSIFQRLIIPTRRPVHRPAGLPLAGVTLVFALLACLLLVATAMMAAGLNNIPPLQLFAALLMAALVGITVPMSASVMLSIGSDYPEEATPAVGYLTAVVVIAALGALGASVLWPLTILVERSLTEAILAGTALAAAGTALALPWAALAWFPWRGTDCEYAPW